MPYISAPYRLSSLLERIRSNILQVPLTDTKGRQIDLAPWPECIDKNGVVHFQDTGRPEAQRMRTVRCKPDIVILATSYTQTFPFLDKKLPYS